MRKYEKINKISQDILIDKPAVFYFTKYNFKSFLKCNELLLF